MKVLIVEDESAAVRRLQKLLGDIDPGIEILGAVSSIESAVEWLMAHPAPDVILMDIPVSYTHLDVYKRQTCG